VLEQQEVHLVVADYTIKCVNICLHG